MNATTPAAQAASFELQEFSKTLGQWVAKFNFTGVTMAAARQLWRDHAWATEAHVRLILADAPEGANVVFGSGLDNPIEEVGDTVPEPGWWSVDGRI